MQAISGAPYTLTFDFKQDGEYVVPDEGSVTYTLYDNSGAAISGQTNVPVDTDNTTNQVKIAIGSGYHTIGSGKDFEQRTIVVAYTLNGSAFQLDDWYYVTPRLNFRVTPMDVITTLGIREGEVLIDEVDLIQAYFKVSDVLTSSVLTTALSSGGIDQLKVNEAIKVIAALDLATVIELKAFRKFGNELSYSRFEKINFDAIRASLRSALSEALSVVSGTDLTSATLFTVTNPTNPLTG